MAIQQNPEEFEDQNFELDGNPETEQDTSYEEYREALKNYNFSPELVNSLVDLNTDQIDELLFCLESRMPEDESATSINIPCDEAIRDYFWERVQNRIANPDTAEKNHFDVIMHLLKQL